MHIVLANQWFPPESGRGGVAAYNDQVARAYGALGHVVTVIASRTSAQIPARVETEGIRVHRLLVKDAYRWRRLPGIGRYVREAQQLAYARRVDAALRALHHERPIDVVEFAEVNAEGFFYARNPQSPVVVRCHTPNFVLKRYYKPREMPFDVRVIGACEKDMIRRAHALTAPSHDMARVIANECGISEDSITVIPNALSIDQFSISLNHPTTQLPNYPTTQLPNYLTILHVGRLERVKGIFVLADAIPPILQQVPHARFVFVGEDRPTGRSASQRAELEAQFTRAGVRSSVEFTDAVDEATLLDWYCRADICVVPSLLYESFSYTCAQAMAAGKPVVASRIGGIPETVDDGVNGIIVTPGNVEQLTEGIVRLALDPALRARMGHAGRAKAEREFDSLQVARRNLQVYERAAHTFGPATS